MRLATAILTLSFLLMACAEDEREAMRVDDYKAVAMAAVSPLSVEDSRQLMQRTDVVFVDVREGDEVEEFGQIEGSVHLPRGVLEFYIDPSSSMHMDIFSTGKKIIFYCETGGRSLLAAKTAKDMGINDVVYLDGGYRAWAAETAD